MLELYLGLCLINGIISYGKGWSFWAGFVVSVFATPVIGWVFLYMRGDHVNPRTGNRWWEEDDY